MITKSTPVLRVLAFVSLLSLQNFYILSWRKKYVSSWKEVEQGVFSIQVTRNNVTSQSTNQISPEEVFNNYKKTKKSRSLVLLPQQEMPLTNNMKPYRRQKEAVRRSTNENFEGISACLLIMDDSIRLLEWLAYHYTTLPLEDLLVVLDPASRRRNAVLEVLDLYKDLIPIKVYSHDSEWLHIPITEGWDGIKVEIYKDNETKTEHQDWFLNKNSGFYQQRAHVRRQNNFVNYCAKYMKQRGRKWTLFTDTDEYLLYNYIHQDEERPEIYDEMRDFTVEKKNAYDKQRRRVKRFRRNLPKMHERVQIAKYLHQTNFTFGQKCVVLPGLSFSSKEYQNRSLDAKSKLLQTYRYTLLGIRSGLFTKGLIDVSHLPENVTLRDVASIHLPSKALCNKIEKKAIFRTDYKSAVLRVHHYKSGSWEAFVERSSDPRIVNDASLMNRYLSRSIEPVLEDEDIIGWLDWFIDKVGNAEAERLLFKPLQMLYNQFNDTDDEIKSKLNELLL